MIKINVFLYSYKNKNLLQRAKNILESTKNSITLHIYDQNSLDRSSQFDKVNGIRYTHINWDSQLGPIHFQKLFIDEVTDGHILILSDDIILQNFWDDDMISFLKNKKVILSGKGLVSIGYKDHFSFKISNSDSNEYELTQWVDPSFIFGRTELFKKIKYPDQLKYYGFAEICSLEFFLNDIKIYSLPKKYYTDMKERRVENLYCPYSLEHNYNTAIDRLYFNVAKNKAVADFLRIHGIERPLSRLPYNSNDIEYSILDTDIKIDSLIGRRRYTNPTNKIS